jgi:hypothetical protein
MANKPAHPTPVKPLFEFGLYSPPWMAYLFAYNSMTSAPSMIGTWVSLPKGAGIPSSPPECIWHVVDDSTCVYEQQTEMGLMISWFQYWCHEEGILRYPLSKATRPMFKSAEYVPILVADTHLIMNGYRFNRVDPLPIPERYDVLPGTRPDENGIRIPIRIRSKVRDHLSEPPHEGEQD